MSAIILRRRKLGRGSAAGIKAASTTGIVGVRNWRNGDLPEGPVDYLFRWGCTSSFPVAGTVVNTSEAIHWCSDKKQGRIDMQAAGVPVPETYSAEAFRVMELGEDEKFVMRPARHAQGRNLMAGTYGDIFLAYDRDSKWRGGYVSTLIDKVAEYRVFVCQNRVVWVAKKTPGNPEDVAWNVARGGRFDNVRWRDWPLDVVRAALAASKVGKLDFAGVDVMLDREGKPYVLEVNSAPSQTSPYRQQCVAKAFDYIVTNGKASFDDVENTPRKTYKSYIHPALRTSSE